jgi:hypothetical protein
MQKVEGSNPFSRFENGLQIQLFPLRAAHFTFGVPEDWLRTGKGR